MHYQDLADINDFWKANGLWFALGLFAILVLTMVLVLVFSLKKNKKEQSSKDNSNAIVDCLGGKENIESIDNKGSRIVVVLKNFALFDEEKLKAASGVTYIKMSNKITFVSDNSKEIYNELIK